MAKKTLSDTEKWIQRLNRKGPFYLWKEVEVDNLVGDKWGNLIEYYVIWNDKEKTKYGYFRDGMLARYGVCTCTSLSGDTVFDLWNGACIDDDIFQEMLKVRNGVSELPKFKLESIRDLRW